MICNKDQNEQLSYVFGNIQLRSEGKMTVGDVNDFSGDKIKPKFRYIPNYRTMDVFLGNRGVMIDDIAVKDNDITLWILDMKDNDISENHALRENIGQFRDIAKMIDTNKGFNLNVIDSKTTKQILVDNFVILEQSEYLTMHLNTTANNKKENNMKTEQKQKKQFTKKQITEAIAYWENYLKKINEASTSSKRDELEVAKAIYDKLSQQFKDARINFNGKYYTSYKELWNDGYDLNITITGQSSLKSDIYIQFTTSNQSGDVEITSVGIEVKSKNSFSEFTPQFKVDLENAVPFKSSTYKLTYTNRQLDSENKNWKFVGNFARNLFNGHGHEIKAAIDRLVRQDLGTVIPRQNLPLRKPDLKTINAYKLAAEAYNLKKELGGYVLSKYVVHGTEIIKDYFNGIRFDNEGNPMTKYAPVWYIHYDGDSLCLTDKDPLHLGFNTIDEKFSGVEVTWYLKMPHGNDNSIALNARIRLLLSTKNSFIRNCPNFDFSDFEMRYARNNWTRNH